MNKLRKKALSLLLVIVMIVSLFPAAAWAVSEPEPNAWVQEKIDNAAGTGTVAVDGQIWLARTSEEGKTYDKGTVVEIGTLEGAKLMVKAPAGI